MLNFEFSLRKLQNLNFHFMKKYYPNSNVIITTYPCIHLYIQHSPFSSTLLEKKVSYASSCITTLHKASKQRNMASLWYTSQGFKTKEYGKLARLKKIMMLALEQRIFIVSVVKGKRLFYVWYTHKLMKVLKGLFLNVWWYPNANGIL